jgi:hypothetical protein
MSKVAQDTTRGAIREVSRPNVVPHVGGGETHRLAGQKVQPANIRRASSLAGDTSSGFRQLPNYRSAPGVALARLAEKPE